jgi:hypothetical protein
MKRISKSIKQLAGILVEGKLSENSDLINYLAKFSMKFPIIVQNTIKELEKYDIEIDFENLSPGFFGYALKNKVVVTKDISRFSFQDVLFLLFHEIGHTQQYDSLGESIIDDTFALPYNEFEKIYHQFEVDANNFSQASLDRISDGAEIKLKSRLNGVNLNKQFYYMLWSSYQENPNNNIAKT